MRFVIAVVFFLLSVSCGIAIFLAVDIAPSFRFIYAVKFRVTAIRKLASAYQFKAAYVRRDACLLLIGRHRAYGRISREGGYILVNFVHTAISAQSSLRKKTRKLLLGDFGRVAPERKLRPMLGLSSARINLLISSFYELNFSLIFFIAFGIMLE